MSAPRVGRNSLEQRLTEIAKWRREAEEARTFRAAQLRKIVQEADHAGWTKTRIAEVAGISRQTVHEMLKD